MSKRKDNKMRAVKKNLFKTYGNYCWLCGKEFRRIHLQGHHIVQYHNCHCTNEENICIVCENCHMNVIHKVPYPSKEYDKLTLKMQNFKNKKRLY